MDSLINWLSSRDTGSSSLYLVRRHFGLNPNPFARPHDHSDRERCAKVVVAYKPLLKTLWKMKSCIDSWSDEDVCLIMDIVANMDDQN